MRSWRWRGFTLPPGRTAMAWEIATESGAPAPSGSVVQILDDLDNLWDVPEGKQAQFVARIAPWLAHDNSLVRALAAQCLGRIGSEAAVEPLGRALADPDKMVWQSAAWALRRLGNRGLGLDTIRTALGSPDPAVRRGPRGSSPTSSTAWMTGSRCETPFSASGRP